MNETKNAWKRGDRAKIAKLAGVSKQLFCDVLKRRKRCPKVTALKLEIASNYMGYEISRKDFSHNLETDNPLFG